MWIIYEHKHLDKTLLKLPIEILKRYEKWKDILEYSGPPGLLKIRGFRDETLKGKWKGYRSSRLNKQYRIIYQIIELRCIVHIIEITAHDYRRK